VEINLYDPKIAMIIIALITLFLDIISAVVYRKLVWTERYTREYLRKKREIDKVKMECEREYREAKSLGDEKRIRKAETKLANIRKAEMDFMMWAMTNQFKTSIITLILFWAAWWWISNMYTKLGQFIILPFPLPFIGIKCNFFWWYMLSALAFGALLRTYYQPPTLETQPIKK